jgi:hypothetical protein
VTAEEIHLLLSAAESAIELREERDRLRRQVAELEAALTSARASTDPPQDERPHTGGLQ